MKPRWAIAVVSLAAICTAQAGVDVRVHGLGAQERENCYSQLQLLGYARSVDDSHSKSAAERGIPPEEYDAEEVQRLFKQGEQDIQAALAPYGWYHPTVQAHLEGEAPNWLATYQVSSGPQTTLTEVDIEFADSAQLDAETTQQMNQLRANLALRKGQRLKHEDYESAKAALVQAAVAAGYLDAQYSRHELRVDPQNNTAQVQLTLEFGPRYYFGEVTLDQDAGLDRNFLMRYVTIQPGAPFSSAQVLATQFALSDLDYFTVVEIDPHKEQMDVRANGEHWIPVTIRGQAKAPRFYRFGAGYGTDTGPRALLGTEFRHLNEQGHKLRLEVRPSQRITTAVAEYKIPFGKMPGEDIDLTAQTLDENVESIQEHLYSIGSGYTHLRGGFQRHDYITYTNDRYTIQAEPQRTSTLLTPGVAYTLTYADDPIDPHRGWLGFIDVHGGTQYALSDTDFVQGHVKLRAVLPLTAALRIYARAEEGATFVSGFDALPPSQRFFAGGDDSVRGYSYRSLAPHGPSGELVGGRYLTTSSVELGYDLGPDLGWNHYGLAVFTDAGGAGDALAVPLHQSVGIGFRYRAPFGAIAVDLAHPLDPGATPVRLHLGVRVGL